jgi:hypothetical protein
MARREVDKTLQISPRPREFRSKHDFLSKVLFPNGSKYVRLHGGKIELFPNRAAVTNLKTRRRNSMKRLIVSWTVYRAVTSMPSTS